MGHVPAQGLAPTQSSFFSLTLGFLKVSCEPFGTLEKQFQGQGFLTKLVMCQDCFKLKLEA